MKVKLFNINYKIKKIKSIKKIDFKLLKKLESTKLYKFLYNFLKLILKPVKTFFTINKMLNKKVKWIISVSNFTLFWKKISYIDDFIIHEKIRWTWAWLILFKKALDFIKSSNSKFTFLVTWLKRVKSHEFYKKNWFKLKNLLFFKLWYKINKNYDNIPRKISKR